MRGKGCLLMAAMVVPLAVAGCTASGAPSPREKHVQPTTTSAAPSAPASSSLPVSCRQAYAALSVLGWGLASQIESTFGCQHAISELHELAARDLAPPGLPVVPALDRPRSLSCASARAVLGVFGVFPPGRAVHSLDTCDNARFIADVLPATVCPLRGHPPGTREVLAGAVARGWAWPRDPVAALLPAPGSLTSVWVDNDEGGMAVQVGAGISAGNQAGDAIFVGVFRPCTLTALPRAGKVHGYGGGGYLAPRGVGALTLERVTGTLVDQNLLIHFAFSGGSGTLDPETGKFRW